MTFCPEDFAFGTPREVCNIHDGNGFDVLDGGARVLSDSGQDWSAQMIRAAEAMLEKARQEAIHVAVLMDVSAACGSQVIYDGARAEKAYQTGPGVCAAMLIRNGYKVVSQRDYRTFRMLFLKLGVQRVLDADAVDHHESEWYRSYFGAEPRS